MPCSGVLCYVRGSLVSLPLCTQWVFLKPWFWFSNPCWTLRCPHPQVKHFRRNKRGSWRTTKSGKIPTCWEVKRGSELSWDLEHLGFLQEKPRPPPFPNALSSSMALPDPDTIFLGAFSPAYIWYPSAWGNMSRSSSHPVKKPPLYLHWHSSQSFPV